MLVKDVTSLDWSISVDGSQGDLEQGVEDINQCIRTICLTPKGSDPLNYEFGCDAYLRLDKPVNVAYPLVVKDVLDALAMWETRIVVTKISRNLNVSHMELEIFWKLKNGILTNKISVPYAIN